MKNSPTYILVHCTDASYREGVDQLQAVNSFHKQRTFNLSTLGYYVGYHALITNKKLYRTRADEEYGNHCASPSPFNDGLSMNFHSLGICIGFDGDTELPPEAERALLKGQIQEWMKKWKIPVERVMFHRDWDTQGKTCPGSLVSRKWLVDLITDAPPVKPPDQVEKQKEIVKREKKINRLQKELARLLEKLLRITNKNKLGSSFMKNGYSLTIAGVIVAAIPQFIDLVNGNAGTSFTEQCLNEVWVNGGTLIGLAIAYIGRIRQGDVNVFGAKK